MDRPSNSQQPASSQTKPVRQIAPSYRSLYLILYNFISAVLWAAVLGRVLLIAWIYGWRNVFAGTDGYVRSVQTLAGLEVVHSLIGMLVFFRVLVDWIVYRMGRRSWWKEGVDMRLGYDVVCGSAAE